MLVSSLLVRCILRPSAWDITAGCRWSPRRPVAAFPGGAGTLTAHEPSHSAAARPTCCQMGMGEKRMNLPPAVGLRLGRAV